MKPIPFDLQLKVFPEETIRAIELWTQTHLHRALSPQEYLEYRCALSIASSRATRPLAKNRDRQLKTFSDSIENMDDHVKFALASGVIERLDFGKRFSPPNTNFNDYIKREAVLDIFKTACEVAYEKSLKVIRRTRLDRDCALSLVSELKSFYTHLTGKDPTPHKSSPFFELVLVGLPAIGYDCTSPERLLKDSFDEKNV